MVSGESFSGHCRLFAVRDGTSSQCVPYDTTVSHWLAADRRTYAQQWSPRGSAVAFLNISVSHKVFTARSQLRISFCFWRSLWLFVCVWNISGTAERICTKFTRKMCLVLRSNEFEGRGQFRRPACGLCLEKHLCSSSFFLYLNEQELSSSWDGWPWPQETWAEKRGAVVPLSRRAGTSSSTMWPGPRSTSVPSGVFIHPTVWPQ